MVINSKTVLMVLLLVMAFNQAKSQTIDELIKSNRKNLSDLYNSRGATLPEWAYSGEVDEGDLQQVLNDYEANVGLLLYTHEKDTLKIFLIDKLGKTLKHETVIEKETLINNINSANQWFSNIASTRAPLKRGSKASSTNKRDKANHKKAYEDISKTLLPFTDQLKTFDHLIIVPTLNVSILPFAALKLTEDEFLIDRLSYSIAPSLYEIMVNHHMKGNRGIYDNEVQYNFENALFVANPKFPNDSKWKFPSLPGTEKEVNYITSKLDSSTYTKLIGKDATLSTIKKNICEYDLIYFATHGISQEIDPLDNSFLVLAENADQSFLTARDIQNIRHDCLLNADLVILSACQTGLGQSHSAGLIGLTRAFQIAGANHVLMSLWSINDTETAKLMSLFFDNLMKGGELMPHEALRQAILTYKNEINDNPNYWAAFSIFGIVY